MANTTRHPESAYKKAGVDVDAGARLVDAIKPLARAPARPGADAALGGFGGLFDLKAAGYADPLLVAGADGVGTKLKIAVAADKHDTIGVDLVAMCVNDVVAQGAEPLFFLDYFASAALREDVAAAVVAGVAAGCKEAGCALIGGETAEMPGVYAPGDYDLAGFCVGAVERGGVLPRTAAPGDVLIGLASSGPHSNGYSLIRKIVDETGASYAAPAPFDDALTLADALLAPTRIYVRAVLAAAAAATFRGFAHVTGGGLTENVPRVLPDGLIPAYDGDAFDRPAPVFDWLREAGGLTEADMRGTFNCGYGGVAVVAPSGVDDALASFKAAGESARVIGRVAAR
ncbi:MAG: phosphoribosylformylglycinamidine cyclo-ligase [Pseudomonadota bacterium]